MPHLLALYDQAFDRAAWHGTPLWGSLRGVRVAEALWRPGRNRHNIWEVVVHAAYWKYVVRRRILGEKQGSFPLKGSNWFMRPDILSEKAWRDDLALLDDCHRLLRECVGGLRRSDLPKKSGGS